MNKIRVRIKKEAPEVLKPRHRSPYKSKPYIHTLAAIFKRYDESLSQADLLFEAFSPERLEAQRVALDRLKTRLEDLGITNIDWSDAYKNVVRYAQYTNTTPTNVAA